MVDTLRINLGGPVLRPGNRLTFRARDEREGAPVGEGVRLPVDGGGWVEAGKVFYNDDLVNLSTRHGEMFLQASLPKVKAEGRDNVEPVDQAEAGRCIDFLRSYLADQVGVITDLAQASVSRADIFANADSKFTFTDYRTLFDTLSLKRQIKRDYGETFLYSNSQRETCIYDKRAELKAKGKETEGLPDNLIRWEYRLLRNRVCKSALGVKKTDRLPVARLLDEWPRLVQVYDKQVRETLGLEGSERQKAEIYTMKAELCALREEAGTKGLRVWLEVYGAKAILPRAGNIDAVRAIVREAGYNKQQVYRFMQDFTRLISKQLSFDFVSLADLKRELYAKLSVNYNKAA